MIKFFSIFSIILNISFLFISILVHFINPEIDILRFPLSWYVHLKSGNLLTTGLFFIGTTEIINGFLLYNIYSKQNSLIASLLIVMGASAYVIAIFPMDIAPNHTATGKMHILAAAIQFVLFPIISFLMSRKNRKGELYKYLYINAFASIIMLVCIYITLLTEWTVLLQFYGLMQKIYIMMIITWLAGINLRVILGKPLFEQST